jgi:hypothetical protein
MSRSGVRPLLRIKREQVALCLAAPPAVQSTGAPLQGNGQEQCATCTGVCCDARTSMDLVRGCAQHAATGVQPHVCAALS